ncbi:MAG: 3'-5' exonuclease [Oscillibacter sp.]|nr:3'-5' exonuclease [Oscillibacter sp.]
MEEVFGAFDRVVTFDTETTGLRFEYDRIIELGAIAYDEDGGERTCECLIRLSEGRRVPPFITDLTGITDEMLAQDGVEESEAAERFCALFDGAEQPLLAAYNAQFDLNFLYWFLRRNGREALLKRLRFLDVLTVYRDRRDYPHKLADAIASYGLTEAENSHRAVDDARGAALVLRAMGREKPDLLRYVNLFGYNERYGTDGRRISSVTYRAQPYTRTAPLYERQGP